MKKVLPLMMFILGSCGVDSSEPGFFAPINPLDVEIADIPPLPQEVPGDRIPIDLQPLLKPTEGPAAQVYTITDASQRIPGDAAHGMVGDWILENERVRFLIEGDDRVMNPCPYGGTVLDVSYKDGQSQDDILGEVCLFINATQTLDPEHFEVIDTGTNAAVLAVTGSLQLGDYLNIPGLVQSYLDGVSISLPFDPNVLLPLRVTIYYILHPGELGLRVVTVLRNDGDADVSAILAHLFMAGGDGRFFNTYGQTRGFGSGSGITDENPVPFVGFLSENEGTMFVPEPVEHLSTNFPRGATSLYVSGVTAVASGISSILGALTNRRFSEVPGVINLKPGEVSASTHWQFGGDGAVGTMLDEVYPLLGFETGEVTGRVVDVDGNAVPGVRVTAKSVGLERAASQAITDANGTYHMRLPQESYTLSARLNSRFTPTPQSVVITPEALNAPDIILATPAQVQVRITTPDGNPTPGRVTVICDGPCPNAPTSLDQDITSDRLPTNWHSVHYSGVDGVVEFDLAEGNYRVTVSRGFEWSTWPYNAVSEGGYPLSLLAGDEIELDAEIAHVVDSTGALSADFHIHALPSPDSPVPIEARVRNFMAEGVDVMVSTDHDFIADYSPAIESLGATREIVSMVGLEITTSGTGHYNAFPLQVDATHRRGGALDWGRDRDNELDPKEVFAWVRDQPGEQVIQVNHATGMGLIGNAQADVLRGITYADRTSLRLDPVEPDPVTGDTKIWDESFTAIEILNGPGLGRFWELTRWWLTMIGRGFAPTGTAVTDTHRLYGDLGGSPRSFVFSPGTPDAFDADAFVQATNSGKVVGSRGPFMRVHAQNSLGQRVGLGETIASEGEAVDFEVELSVPEWMPVNRLEIYYNRTDVITEPGKSSDARLEPDRVVTFELTPDDLQVVATGTSEHRRYAKTVPFQMEVTEDTYVVVMVYGDQPMTPVTTGHTPFAFANPIFIDADGNGYDNPPLAALAQTPPQRVQAIQTPVVVTEDLMREALLYDTCH
jgi:hypothetical protein